MNLTTSRIRAGACAILFLVGGCHGSMSMGTGVHGSGVAKTETRAVAPFDAIELHGAMRLDLTTGPLDKLSLSGDDNIVPLITTTVSGGKLVVSEKEDIDPKTPLVLTVRAPTVSRIEVSGAATVHATGLQEPSFSLDASGASNTELSGKVFRLEVHLSGAGRVHAQELEAKQAHVTLSGAGTVEVNATDSLKAEVSGVGMVHYAGTPKVEKSISGMGVVAPLK